jgi:hypothetical protein
MRIILIALSLWLGAFVSGEAQAQRVTLEIAPAVSRSEPQLTSYLRRALPAEIQKSLAGKYTGPLRVRINDAKFMRHPGFGIVNRADYLDGVLIVPGREAKPIRLTLPFDRNLFMFSPQGEAVRAQNLASVFAQWVAKYI